MRYFEDEEMVRSPEDRTVDCDKRYEESKFTIPYVTMKSKR